MKKTALLVAALSMTIYAQSPGVPKSPAATATRERLRQMITAGSTNRPSPPQNVTVTAGAPAQATTGLPNPTAGVSLPSQATSAASGAPTAAAGGPAGSQSASAESAAPLTPREIQILRSWIHQGGISALAPAVKGTASASSPGVETSSGVGLVNSPAPAPQ